MPTSSLTHIKPSSMDELCELLATNKIDTTGWGISPIRSLEKLLKTLKNNYVYFIKSDSKPLTLHVHSVVVYVWYMSTPMLELFEEFQQYPNGEQLSRHEQFDGLGETSDFIGGQPEDFLEGAHRLLQEELGQSQPLFLERERYHLFRMTDQIKEPMIHDKWPLRAVFHRHKSICQIEHNSPLFLHEGYTELTDDGRTIKFSWRDKDAKK